LFSAVLGVCAVSVPCGCGRLQSPPPQEPVVLTASELDERLGADDVLEVRVAGEGDMTGTYRVDGDGTFDFPYVGRMTVVGMQASEVQREIARALKEKQILTNPQVSVMVKEWNSRRVSVLGQVNKPGTVAYFPRMTIVDAIAAVGGFTGIAAKNSVTLRREREGRVVSHTYPVADISEGRAGNVTLVPGDVLVVEERLF
jgi:polysaccharide export outer membrane protein